MKNKQINKRQFQIDLDENEAERKQHTYAYRGKDTLRHHNKMNMYIPVQTVLVSSLGIRETCYYARLWCTTRVMFCVSGEHEV